MSLCSLCADCLNRKLLNVREIFFFVASEEFADLSVVTEDLLLSAAFCCSAWDKQHVCPFVDICLSLYVCVGLSWVGSRLKFCLRCCGPPNGKVLTLPSSSLPRPLLTYIHTLRHTHTHAGSRDDLPVPLQCHSASNFSFIQTQTAFPSSVFNPRERHGGGGMKREEIRKMLASHNLSRFITLSSKVQISYMYKLVKLQVAVSLSFRVKAREKTTAKKTWKLSLFQEKKESQRQRGHLESLLKPLITFFYIVHLKNRSIFWGSSIELSYAWSYVKGKISQTAQLVKTTHSSSYGLGFS